MTLSRPSRLLILSDGKPGHLNQAIAFAKHIGFEFDICRVKFKHRAAKAISYLADHCGLLLEGLCQIEPFSGEYAAVVSAGSETYYANRLLAKKHDLKSVAIMLPQGYRLDFDLIVAQQHDNPPERENILCLPINLSYVEPQGLVTPTLGEKYVALIIGGDSKHAQLQPGLLHQQLTQVFTLFPEHKFWLTTSRRTSAEIEAMLQGFQFERAVFYSVEQINPIPDFLQHSEYLFLTADSTSMISEAVSYGSASVEVLPLRGKLSEQGKLGRMLMALQEEGSVHIFDGSLGAKSVKVDLSLILQRIEF